MIFQLFTKVFRRGIFTQTIAEIQVLSRVVKFKTFFKEKLNVLQRFHLKRLQFHNDSPRAKEIHGYMFFVEKCIFET